MKYKKIRLFALVFAMAVLVGCGSDSGSSVGTTSGEPEVSPEYLGDINCLSCHEDQKHEWLKAHGNLDVETLFYNPSYPLPDASCEACHDRWRLTDPDAEGRGWTLTGDHGPVRPVVSCEACHGAGGFHFGMGPLPQPVPGVDTCISCHDANVPDDPTHRSTHIAEDYMESKHAESPSMEDRETISARCTMCHTDEGFIRYSRAYNFDGVAQRTNPGYAMLDEFFADRAAYDKEDVTPIGCRTCHRPHSGELRAPQTEDLMGEVIYSREFNTCTSCHQVFLTHDPGYPDEDAPYFLDPDIYGGESGFDWSDPANAGRLEYHNPVANPYGSISDIISDTHFPGWLPKKDEDDLVSQERIKGYYFDGAGLDPGAHDSCTNCHDPHAAAMGWFE